MKKLNITILILFMVKSAFAQDLSSKIPYTLVEVNKSTITKLFGKSSPSNENVYALLANLNTIAPTSVKTCEDSKLTFTSIETSSSLELLKTYSREELSTLSFKGYGASNYQVRQKTSTDGHDVNSLLAFISTPPDEVLYPGGIGGVLPVPSPTPYPGGGGGTLPLLVKRKYSSENIGLDIGSILDTLKGC